MPLLHDSAKFTQRIIKIFTFSVSFTALCMGLSFIPLLPQPLPIIISFILSFLILNDRREGIIIGSFLIGFGLIYHMSRINFILILGRTETKLLFLSFLIIFFLFIPTISQIYEDIIAISIGIIASLMLFFHQTYFLAIPLIIVFAGIYKKQRIWLTMSYYAAISIPTQIMQYMKYIYNEEFPTLPPLYIPLIDIFNDMQESMKKISINEISRVLEVIAGQFKSKPDPSLRYMMSALSEYINSIPGIIFFLIIMFSLVSITAYIMSHSLKIIESMEITKKYSKHLEIFFSVITVTIITTIFYIFLVVLQEPLSYMAEISISKIATGILGTAIITTPISYINYGMKISTILGERSEIIMKNSKKLIEEIEHFKDLIKKLNEVIPIKVDILKMEANLIEDKILDILDNLEYETKLPISIDSMISGMETEIKEEISNLHKKLNVLLDEYYRNENYEFQTLINNYREVGIEVINYTPENYNEDEKIDIKIEKITKMLNKELEIAAKIMEKYEKIYNILRVYYDPSLPEESSTLRIAKQKIQEKESPCIILEAIQTSLNNLEMKNLKEITTSILKLNELLNSFKNILKKHEKMTINLGESYKKLLDIENKVNKLKNEYETNTLKISNIIVIDEILNCLIKIYKEVFQIFYDEITLKENDIEKLARDKGIEWSKNNTLKEKIIYILQTLKHPQTYNINEIISTLEMFLAQFDECIETITNYNQTHEILVNYEVSEHIINQLLGEKGIIYYNEIPFKKEITKKYMEIYSEKHKDFVIYDKEKLIICRRDKDVFN